MADGQVQVRYGLDITEAQAELQKLKTQLNGLTADFQGTARVISRNVTKMTRDLRDLLKDPPKGASVQSIQRKYESARDRSLAHQARGGPNAQLMDSAIRSLIAETRTSERMLQARLTDEMVKSSSRIMRNTHKSVQARLSNEMVAIERMIENSQADLINANRTLRGRANANRIETAGNTSFLNAQDRSGRRRRGILVEEEGDFGLIEARENRRRRRNAELKRSNSDLELQAANEQSKRLNEELRVMRANTPGYADALRTEAEYAAHRKMTAAARREEMRLAREARRDPALEAARGIIAGDNRERTLFEASRGRAAASMRLTRERFDSNGGADMMGLQGRIMANGIAIASAFQAARGLATFVVQLDKELTQFQAISTATNREMETMKTRLLDLSATVPFTTLEMAQAATTMAQAGLSTREVSDSLQAVATFATASGSDLAKSVDIVTSAMTAFNLQTSQTADVANTFTAALNLSKLTVDKLVTAMNYIAPTASAMGMSVEETVSILGALSQSGLRASTMATGARTLLVGLQNPSKKFLEVLKDLGLTQHDVNVESEGFLNVMERLKAAGFGAAQAYEAFELRGAAAFVALSNNTELAYEMQKAFSLSAAAVEANDIQMTSLANTAKNFGSAIGGAAYQAFNPLLDVLQSALAGATQVLGVLNQFPGVLNAIAIGATLIGTASVLGLFGSMFRGLSGMIPLMGTFAANAKGVTGVLTGLFAILRFHPLTAFLSVVTSVAVALYSFGTAGKEAAAEIDALRGRVNELKGETDALDKSMSAIDQVLESVVKQKVALDENPLMREAKIMEIQKQFKELGATIDASTSSVTDLIRELHNLKNSQAELRAAASGSQLQAEKNLADAYQRELDAFFRNAVPPDRIGQGLRARQQQNASGLTSDDNVNRALRLVNGDRSLLGNYAEMEAMGANLDRTLNEMRGQRAGETDEAVIETLDNNIRFLENLQGRFQELNTIVQKLAAANQDVKVTAAQHQLNIIQNTAGFKKLDEDITAFDAAIEQDRSDIFKGERGTSDEDKLNALRTALAFAKQAAERLKARSGLILEQARAKDSSITAADVEAALNATLEGRSASLLASMGSSVDGIEEDVSKFYIKEFKRKQKLYSKELTRLAGRRSDSLTQEELDSVTKSIEATLADKASGIRNHFDELIEAADSEEDKSKLREEMEQALEEVANLAEDHALAAVEKSNDILKDSLKQQQTNIDDQAKTLKKKIDEVTAMLKIARPGEAVDKLKASLASMIEAFNSLMGQSNSLGLQQDVLGFSKTPVPGKVADRAAMAMSSLMGQNIGKNVAAAIVGNLMVESNLNPRAAGDYRNGHPTSFGLAQHRGSRWDNLRRFTGSSMAFDFQSQLAFILHELQSEYPGLLKRMTAASPGEAAAMFMKEFERPSSDPNINHVGRRVGYANSLAETDYAGQTAEMAEVQKTAGENIVIGVNRAVEDSLNARLRAVDQNVDSAQTALSVAQRPENAGKYTGVDIMALEENVRLAERAALLERIKITEEQIAAAKQQQTTTEPGTQEHEDALRRETELKEKLVDLTNQKNLADAATANQGPSVAQAIQAANVAWAQQEGLLDGRGGLVSAAKQVESAWGQVLSGLSSGFSTFFKNIASGTMSAGEAFKQLGLSVVQMFMDIIAKALANQIIMALFGAGGGGGGGLFASLAEGLFGVVGGATGGGIPGAATGEYITGGVPGRDSVLRKTMPGEYILRASAVKAIGRDNLDAMNNAANRKMSEGVAPLTQEKRQQPQPVNVWVVSPDQVPPPGPNDIIATVADNIQRRGSLKQLIQQVNMGTI